MFGALAGRPAPPVHAPFYPIGAVGVPVASATVVRVVVHDQGTLRTREFSSPEEYANQLIAHEKLCGVAPYTSHAEQASATNSLLMRLEAERVPHVLYSLPPIETIRLYVTDAHRPACACTLCIVARTGSAGLATAPSAAA